MQTRGIGHLVGKAHAKADAAARAAGRLPRRCARPGRAPPAAAAACARCRPSMPRPSSRQYCGSCVLLPEPVSPATISTCSRCKRLHDVLAARGNRQIGVVLEDQRRAIASGALAPALAPRADRAPPAPRSRRSLATLDFLPQPLLRREIEFVEDLAALRRQRFHAAKSPLEFRVGGSAAPPRHRRRACAPDWRPRTTDRRFPRRYAPLRRRCARRLRRPRA